MPAFKPVTPTQALIVAIHAVQPAVLRGSVVISTDSPGGLDTASVVFALSPELIAATVVDHKIPHRGDQALFWDKSNWQSLCATHHSRDKQRDEARMSTS